MRINVVEVERVDGRRVSCLAEYIAQQLEKRVAFRRTIRMAVQRAQRAGVLGLKIQVSGRLNGAEIARTEWTREGRVPLHTLRAEIDYATKVAVNDLRRSGHQGLGVQGRSLERTSPSSRCRWEPIPAVGGRP